MVKTNKLRKKLSLFHYNIGFFDFDASILEGRQPRVKWMEHGYRDRFFADPFILDVDDEEIRVLVEDFEYKKWKGSIALLVVDKRTYALKRKKTILELDTHLSFPFIARENGETYVVPENQASGRLTAYRYDAATETLVKAAVLTEMPVVDPVIAKKGDSYLLFGSIQGREENRQLFAWRSDELLGSYKLITETPVKQGAGSSRRGGDFFEVGGRLYAATQCCEHSYGEALNICEATIGNDGSLKESVVATITPQKPYVLGLHTLNICKGMCVVDGLTFLFRPWEKIWAMMKKR